MTIEYSHILCPVDFSETSTAAFLHALGYTRLFGAQLTVLHVCDRDWAVDGFDDEDDRAEMERRMVAGVERRLAEMLEHEHVSEDDRKRIDLAIENGRPWEQIVAYADTRGVDLIVIGTHGHTGLRHMVIGSQAERVVRVAPCPVLTLRSGSAS